MKAVRVVKKTFIVPEGCVGSGTAPRRSHLLSYDSKKAPSVKNRVAERASSHGCPVGISKVGYKPFPPQPLQTSAIKEKNSLGRQFTVLAAEAFYREFTGPRRVWKILPG